MIIDCDRCSERGRGCADCVVGVLLDDIPGEVALTEEECAALDILADAGLVPPLRLTLPPEEVVTA
jgi:hypothetical protein